jgi:hypothetical protein
MEWIVLEGGSNPTSPFCLFVFIVKLSLKKGDRFIPIQNIPDEGHYLFRKQVGFALTETEN